MPGGNTHRSTTTNTVKTRKLNMANGHYTAGGISSIDVIKAKLTPEQYKGFLLGNVIKYTLRANWKDDFNKDMAKCSEYITWLNDLGEQNGN